MGERFWRLSGALVLMCAMTAGVWVAPAAAEGPTRVWQPAGDQYVPRTDGETVVWLDGRSEGEYGSSYEIYGARMDDGGEFPIATGKARRSYPDIDDNVAIWMEHNYACDSCSGDIVGIRLATGETFVIAGTEFDESRSAISGNHAVWVERGNTGDTLMGRNIDSMDEPFVIATAISGMRMDLPRFQGDRVVWGEFRRTASGSGASDYTLRLTTLFSEEIQTVSEGTVNSRDGLSGDYDVRGELVAFADDRDLQLLNLSTGETRQLSTAGACPTIDGHYIFWEDFRSYAETGNIELWGYDMVTGGLFQAATGPGSHEYANVRDGLMVWQGKLDHEDDIFAAPVVKVLPTAPRREESTPEDAYFFPETTHTLGNQFKSFWDASGGLPVFGYSLTEAFSELNADTGEMYTVQYLERQRFELHPELAGTPYEVLIGRLGVAAAGQRGYLETEAFQPLPSDPGGDGCQFFSETGHTLCSRFQTYWQSSGLEMGDEGVSFRESLALFGYPISEEFTDPETGLTSQYFERAIFEYHPENDGTPFEVLLVRLGAQELAERGW